MRTTKKVMTMTALAAVMMLGACGVNDDTQDVENSAVRFTGGIGETATLHGVPMTKAVGTTWGDDAIGIFMVDHGGITVAMGATNKEYETTAGGNNTFTAVSGNEIYYPQTGSVDFFAYYPYASGAELTTPIDVEIGTVQTAISQPTFDLLWAKADNSSSGYSKTTHATVPVALKFDHKLTKIVMKTTKANRDLTGMAVTIKGMNTKNTFDLETGTLGTASTKANITPQTITDGSEYDAIIMPGNYNAGDVTVEFTLSGETFIWTLPLTEFLGGNEYTYNVTLKRTGVTVTGSINPWIIAGNDRGDVVAE